jgi:hypothetical protein
MKQAQSSIWRPQRWRRVRTPAPTLMPAIAEVGGEIVLIYDLCPLLRFREGGKAGMRSAGYITAGSFSPKRVCRLPSAS